ncbi:TPA_exp: Spermine/spermidine synthase family protein [Trichophyton benhamiae CBS 112371]|uniref:Spermine/spermidine synthase family protein n=1 Tax=Arthroderma benhamiae (strain ATCC MYA-4681 / CBS 112371) TaxID=663331 RepID=D4ARB4_ARTBC|nr:spermine/spermidine synthase family protein [Trichophyton benhamiae CBS 112371]EFE34257.1 spermine/spermidine synthase family protein [Trichophyton benhamiae CBS 112371]DAA77214.1 TPA_exp: Spermine/spermidine synthase family protein [Trichophyton benhamiae CBS 112371]
MAKPKSTPSKPAADKIQPAASTPAARGAVRRPAAVVARKSSLPELFFAGAMGAAVIALAGAYSYASQLTLAPIYGSAPAGKYHNALTLIAGGVGSLAHSMVQKYANPMVTLPILTFYIPTIQFFLFKFSYTLGPVLGPIITETLTFAPLVALSVVVPGIFIQKLNLSPRLKQGMEQGNIIAAYALFNATKTKLEQNMPYYLGTSLALTSIGLQFIIAAAQAILLPSRWIMLTIPSLLFTAMFNHHVPLPYNTGLLNASLKADNYTLLHRQESLTGYLSVLENTDAKFRVMRCGHSLLGGEWLPHLMTKDAKVADPVFTVFTALEAVRLVKKDSHKPEKADSKKSALVIGLGIGTTPSAFAAHGINTTVVEIDPNVHQIAMDYFEFPKKVNTLIENAAVFVHRARHETPVQKYDYIVHDVFTGGVEPLDLFTQDFMEGLDTLLDDEGVIAINYAGDIALPLAGLVVRAITSTFPSCRIFRDNKPLPGSSSRRDLTNMTIFCKKTPGTIKFRIPQPEDYLGTYSRKENLIPRLEFSPGSFARDAEGREDALGPSVPKELEYWQFQGAIGHWHVMRGVLPDTVWEKW